VQTTLIGKNLLIETVITTL